MRNNTITTMLRMRALTKKIRNTNTTKARKVNTRKVRRDPEEVIITRVSTETTSDKWAKAKKVLTPKEEAEVAEEATEATEAATEAEAAEADTTPEMMLTMKASRPSRRRPTPLREAEVAAVAEAVSEVAKEALIEVAEVTEVTETLAMTDPTPIPDPDAEEVKFAPNRSHQLNQPTPSQPPLRNDYKSDR